jgi:hypothetical protein
MPHDSSYACHFVLLTHITHDLLPRISWCLLTRHILHHTRQHTLNAPRNTPCNTQTHITHDLLLRISWCHLTPDMHMPLYLPRTYLNSCPYHSLLITLRHLSQCGRHQVMIRARCNTLHHTATYCNILQHTATHMKFVTQLAAFASRSHTCATHDLCHVSPGVTGLITNMCHFTYHVHITSCHVTDHVHRT